MSGVPALVPRRRSAHPCAGCSAFGRLEPPLHAPGHARVPPSGGHTSVVFLQGSAPLAGPLLAVARGFDNQPVMGRADAGGGRVAHHESLLSAQQGQHCTLGRCLTRADAAWRWPHPSPARRAAAATERSWPGPTALPAPPSPPYRRVVRTTRPTTTAAPTPRVSSAARISTGTLPPPVPPRAPPTRAAQSSRRSSLTATARELRAVTRKTSANTNTGCIRLPLLEARRHHGGGWRA